MKKRIVSFLLALVMAASCVPTALAAGEGRMAVAVSTAGGVVIAPQYVDCAQGETVWQVLSRMEGHTFTEASALHSSFMMLMAMLLRPTAPAAGRMSSPLGRIM